MKIEHISRATAHVNFAEFLDTKGRLVLLPMVLVRQALACGESSLRIEISLDQMQPFRTWLTVTEAAKEHLDDVDGMTLQRAQVKITRACNAGRIVCEGSGSKRRIEPTSFEAWRRGESDKNLARCDED